jgi:hypothetical protein
MAVLFAASGRIGNHAREGKYSQESGAYEQAGDCDRHTQATLPVR